VTCSRLQLDLWIFTTTRPNLNYFDHSHNHDAIIKNSILLVGSILHLFSTINRLICPISRNSNQISCILNVFDNDIGVYFNVWTKIIYIYTHKYIVHIMNLKINIWTLIFYSNLRIDISILKTIIFILNIYISEFETWYLIINYYFSVF
jgi:hypothetical protein